MFDEKYFVRAILDHPQDVAPRLMLADWFEERGDMRGELLRIQCELTSLPEFPDSWLLESRMLELLEWGARPVGAVVENSIGMRLVLIPAGEFLMGSPKSFLGEGSSWAEHPEHRVVLRKPFFLGLCPVTQHQYKEVIGFNPSYYEGFVALGNRPVERVSWFDVVRYCNRLSEDEGVAPYYCVQADYVSINGGRGYRLPTEAEWEYACRAGTGAKWSFGNNCNACPRFCWIRQNSQGEPHPVREKPPNPWGLFDMHGNVWEWCWDWFDETYYDLQTAIDPEGPTLAKTRVKRGGSFDEPADWARSGFRYFGGQNEADRFTGFRVAKNVEEP